MSNLDEKHWEYTFCHWCESEKVCNKIGFPKILECNQIIIQFAYEIQRGFKIYVWEGNYRQQPLWFNELLAMAENEINIIRNKKAKGKK